MTWKFGKPICGCLFFPTGTPPLDRAGAPPRTPSTPALRKNKYFFTKTIPFTNLLLMVLQRVKFSKRFLWKIAYMRMSNGGDLTRVLQASHSSEITAIRHLLCNILFPFSNTPVLRINICAFFNLACVRSTIYWYLDSFRSSIRARASSVAHNSIFDIHSYLPKEAPFGMVAILGRWRVSEAT